METLRCLSPATLVAALVVLLAAVLPANGQTPMSPCTASMLTSFTPCMNFLGNNTANMTTPTPGCCSSLKSLATNGTGCLCQILSGGVPFQVPVNRTSAISLPRSCNMANVPLQCNLATGAPAPAPGSSSVALAPALSPTTTASPPSPTASATPAASAAPPAEAPVSDTTPTLTPPTATSPTATTETPPATAVTPGKASNPATSAAQLSLSLSPSLLLVPVALVMMKYY